MDKNWHPVTEAEIDALVEQVFHGSFELEDAYVIHNGEMRLVCSNKLLFRQTTPNFLTHPTLGPFAALDRVLKKAVELNLAQ